jgi:hypothetical protein
VATTPSNVPSGTLSSNPSQSGNNKRSRVACVRMVISLWMIGVSLLGTRTVGEEQESPLTEQGPSFFHEVIPVLSKQGCSSGACHGSPNGKNGFRLSLRGYDAPLDAHAIVREELGRRVDRITPEESLLLAKPLMQVPHGGGKRLDPRDPAYEIVLSWIAHGCSVSEPSYTCSEIFFDLGDELLLSPDNDLQQLTVWALFSDGSRRDVSHLSVYSSSDSAVASVTDQGLVTGLGRGQAAISARYLEHWSTLYVTFVPGNSIVGGSRGQPRNEVDEHVDRQLKQLHFAPSEPCSDEHFIRRVYLDVIGTLPTISEVQAFLDCKDAGKRATLIDSLLDRPEYGRFWALKWGDLLRINKQQISEAGVHKYNRWLVNALNENMPYDQFAAELLLSRGSTFENPPANFYRTAGDLHDATETVAQIFLGVRLECCKCHNHPFEKWTQDNYYGFAAFFNRLQRKPSRRADEMTIWIAREGEVIQPRTNQKMLPWLPGDGNIRDDDRGDRRIALVEWLTSDDNEFFAAVEVNRLWSHVMGRGIVEPVDDFRNSNPPSNPKLLDALAADFREYGFNRKRTLRRILNSRTYQASSVPTSGNQDDAKYFSHYRARLLTAEQLLDAIGSFTERPEHFAGLPTGTLATQLPSPDTNLEFLEVFGQPKRETVCQCERSTEVTLSQALQIANGTLVQNKLTSPGNRLRKLLESELADEQVLHALYLAAFARYPTRHELQVATSHLAKHDDRELAWQDVAWALMNSNEFLMQH